MRQSGGAQATRSNSGGVLHPSRVRLQARKSRCRLSRCSQQERPVKGEALTLANGLLYTFALRQIYCSRTRVIQFAEGVRSPCFRSVFLSTGLCFQKSVTSVPSRSERDCRWLERVATSPRPWSRRRMHGSYSCRLPPRTGTLLPGRPRRMVKIISFVFALDSSTEPAREKPDAKECEPCGNESRAFRRVGVTVRRGHG